MAATNAERQSLVKIARQNERVAKADVEARKAELIADAEERLARRFEEQDAAWADLMAEARQYMTELKAKLDAKCAERGITASFRPGVEMYWFDRGENSDPRRRSELRKMITTRADAAAKRAKLEIERQSARVQQEIIAGGFETDEARELLSSLPTPEALMPALDLPELEAGR